MMQILKSMMCIHILELLIKLVTRLLVLAAWNWGLFNYICRTNPIKHGPRWSVLFFLLMTQVRRPPFSCRKIWWDRRWARLFCAVKGGSEIPRCCHARAQRSSNFLLGSGSHLPHPSTAAPKLSSLYGSLSRKG